jgi:aspartate-semialdehyde dehydrogenase
VSVVVLINPTTLVGKELRERLESRPDLGAELRLLSPDEEEVGTLTEIRGAAAVVVQAREAELEGADLVVFCGDREAALPLLGRLPAGATAVLLAPDATPDDGLPLVAGINLEALDEAPPGTVLLSPHPGAVLLAHLLHPLRDFVPLTATATLLQPASLYGEAGLDELYAQARRVIALAGREDPTVLPGQLAFNAFPSALPGEHVAAEVEAVLGGGAAVSVEVCQAPVFHGFSAALYLTCEQSPEPEELRQALGDSPFVRLADDDQPLGPTEAAASDEVLVGPVRRTGGRGGGYWIWSVMDNLTRGGALNALAIAERVLRGGVR